MHELLHDILIYTFMLVFLILSKLEESCKCYGQCHLAKQPQ